MAEYISWQKRVRASRNRDSRVAADSIVATLFRTLTFAFLVFVIMWICSGTQSLRASNPDRFKGFASINASIQRLHHTIPDKDEDRLVEATKNKKNGRTESDNDKDLHEVYSLWLQPSSHQLFITLTNTIQLLGEKFNGTWHQPHAVLYGPIFTTNQSYVRDVAEKLARTIAPFQLTPKSVEIQRFNQDTMWRGGITLCYKETTTVMNNMRKACAAFDRTDFQQPRTSLLYDYGGASAAIEGLNTSLWDRLTEGNPSNITWTAHDIRVWYTPLRTHWRSWEDMRNIVDTWRKVATYRFKGGSS